MRARPQEGEQEQQQQGQQQQLALVGAQSSTGRKRQRGGAEQQQHQQEQQQQQEEEEIQEAEEFPCSTFQADTLVARPSAKVAAASQLHSCACLLVGHMLLVSVCSFPATEAAFAWAPWAQFPSTL